MNLSRTHTRTTLAVLALLSMVLLCLAAAHEHQPGDHAECWLCTASIGHIALISTAFVLGVFWVYLFGISVERPARQFALAHLPEQARAPPLLSSI